ncbi:MAG: DUF86 domain-containing protein, partial [Chlamydiia bacterium]
RFLGAARFVMPRDPIAYLNDMLKAVVDLQELASTSNIAEKWRVQAMLHLLQILGEFAKRVPLPIQKRTPAIPWKGLMGLRDVIVHKYFRLNLNIVRHLLKDLPLMEKSLRDLLHETL